MKKILKGLLSRLMCEIKGNENIEVSQITSDSREVKEGGMFFAVRGTATDGHDYIEKAQEQGASVVVCEQLPVLLSEQVTYVLVKDSSDALGKLAAAWFDYPSEKLSLVGVTGTNGKTTTATLLYKTFRAMGHRVGLLSTVCNYINDEAYEATHTTPDAIHLNALLNDMVNADCDYAFMEVSSHSVDQNRISGLRFEGGIFTNLTRDHLDYHKTFDAYLKAKKKFFDTLPKDAFAITNADDKNGLIMLQNCEARKYTYSLRTLADYKGKIIENHFDGMTLEVNGIEAVLPFVGVFNAYNLLAVIGAANQLGKSIPDMLVALSKEKPVSGRFETLRSKRGYTAIVDYAHTPDALTNVLNAIHEVLDGNGRVITVVGCGGNRDKGKRPIMAKESAKLSDRVILTSDNPRNEEPQDILNDMLEGLDIIDRKKTLTIADRREAIRTACMFAEKGDVVLIAGKGHEDYQIIKGVKHHFDDREEVKVVFEQE
ncbi:MAG: UDP-N-acetylmuramoyl-L-alanyl-D-glutamate--2,6-diaminopimelate ligase [Bacteroidales bacterium]